MNVLDWQPESGGLTPLARPHFYPFIGRHIRCDLVADYLIALAFDNEAPTFREP